MYRLSTKLAFPTHRFLPLFHKHGAFGIIVERPVAFGAEIMSIITPDW